MRTVIFSDVHANLQALRAVLEHANENWPGSRKVCLGDTVGYGANPVECLNIVRQVCSEVAPLRGNHDHGAICEDNIAPGTNEVARCAMLWTHRQVEDAALVSYLRSLVSEHVEGDVHFVHGSPCDPMDEYVFPHHSYVDHKMSAVFTRIQGIAFAGHTHTPAVFFRHEKGYVCAEPQSLPNGVAQLLPEDRYLINVGSVGQPRDGNPKACYVVYDSEENIVFFQRVAYDVEAAKTAIYLVPELDNFLGDRLEQGR